MREGEAVVHRGRLELTRVGASAASSPDGNRHIAMVSKVRLSEEEKVWPHIVTTPEEEVYGTVGSAFRGR